MDIKEQITKAVKEITSNKSLQEEFKKEPVKTVEKVLGVDLPDSALDDVVKAVKAKVSVDSVADVADKLKKLF